MVKGVNLNQPGTERENVRVLTLSGLEVQEPYLAISTQAKSGAADFANIFYRLIELYTPEGEAIPFTYGPCTETTDYNSWLCSAGAEKATFPNYGSGSISAGIWVAPGAPRICWTKRSTWTDTARSWGWPKGRIRTSPRSVPLTPR